MNRLFDPNNFLFRALSWAVDIVGVSLLWLFLCLPVITVLPATAALYHTCALCIRRGEAGAFTRFFRSFRRDLRQGCLLTLPLAAAGLLLFLGHGVMYQAAIQVGGYAAVMYGVYSVAMLLPLGLFCWLPALLGRFDFSSLSLFRGAAFLTLRHLPASIFAVAVAAGAAVGCLVCVPLLFVLPVGAGIVVSLPMERVFRRYQKELVTPQTD